MVGREELGKGWKSPILKNAVFINSGSAASYVFLQRVVGTKLCLQLWLLMREGPKDLLGPKSKKDRSEP